MRNAADELVRAGLDRDPGEAAERAGAGAEAEADGVAEERKGAVVAELAGGVRGSEGGGLDRLEAGVEAGDLVVAAAEGAEDEEVLRFGGFGGASADRVLA